MKRSGMSRREKRQGRRPRYFSLAGALQSSAHTVCSVQLGLVDDVIKDFLTIPFSKRTIIFYESRKGRTILMLGFEFHKKGRMRTEIPPPPHSPYKKPRKR